MSEIARYADTTVQELLQLVSETRYVEGQDTGASREFDRSSLDAQGIANLQRCNYFKNPVGSTLLFDENRKYSAMNTAMLKDAAHWYVIHTHAKQEDRAEANLRVLGVQVFNPKIKERRCNRYTNALTYITKPFFPRYLFAQFSVNDSYHKVRFTRGVYSIVAFGDGPTSVDEGLITLIQANIGKDGFVKIDEDLRPGDHVIVKDGLLKNFVGVFVREMKGTDRVKILLQTVSYQAHIEIERDTVRRIS